MSVLLHVVYALLKLQLSDARLKVDQHSSMKAIYDGHDVFVWLPTGYGESLFSNLICFNGFQEGSHYS